MGSPSKLNFLADVVLENIQEPIFVIDEYLNFVLWNKAIVDLTQIAQNELLGLPILQIFKFAKSKIEEDFSNRTSISSNIRIEEAEFSSILMPLFEEGRFIGYKGSLNTVQEGILGTLPREYLVDVINSSPMSTIIFNTDGSIFYSNNAYIDMWNLSKDELAYVNNNYNIFLDKQLKQQGLMEEIESAFAGEMHQSPVFEYSFNSDSLGRNVREKKNWLLAHIFPIKDANNLVQFVVLNFSDVTTKYNLEEAFKDNKERLQLALKGGDLGTWDWNLETGEVIYNKRWAKMLGYDLDEAYLLSWENLLHPEDKEKAIAALDALVDGTSEVYDSEYRLKAKDGTWRWILDRGKIVARSKKEQPIRVAGTHIDITDRMLSEEKLRENELKYRKLVENAPIGIAIVAKGKIMYLNDELAKIGRIKEKDTVIGMPVTQFISDSERYSTFKERENLVVNKGQNAPLYTTKLSSITGELIDVEIVSIPINYQGEPAMQVMIHDITDRLKALNELSTSRELLNQLFENSPMGIVLLDKEFKVSNLNKGFEHIFGFDIETLKGKSLSDYIISDELINEANKLNRSAINGEIDYVESYRFSKTGEKIPVIIYALPVIENNKHIGIYGIYVDIRQRIEIEEELKTRNLELDNFVYKVSHDLRAPLASILGLINLTKLEGASGDQDYYIELMEGQINKLDHFIRDILSHSKNLKMSVAADNVDFNEIVDKCFNDLGYLKAASKIVRKVNISDGTFVSDIWRINEIFRNLISNAIKYRNPDAKENIVEVTITIDEKGCDIVVSDNGIGIPEDKLPHVLEMFYRGTETSDGSGIGLYIVQRAVEKLSGRLSIESLPNAGTKFSIWLPSLTQERLNSQV